MASILVTGANKGIGLAIVAAILTQQREHGVLLGSRDLRRGEAARQGLLERHPEWAERLELLELDVTEDASVTAAARRVAERFAGSSAPLHALVNNAGIGWKGALREVMAVNVLGIQRTCAAFLPLIDPHAGRIVNATSAAGPSFVAKCSPEQQRFLTRATLDWPQLRGFLEECLAVEGGAAAFAARGLSDGDSYGLTKACANALNLILARENPGLRINACTPGYIETDLTRPHATAQGKSPAAMGMKPPEAGTKAPCHLLFSADIGTGHYYGSDAQRSPLDRYRAPGSAPHTGP